MGDLFEGLFQANNDLDYYQFCELMDFPVGEEGSHSHDLFLSFQKAARLLARFDPGRRMRLAQYRRGMVRGTTQAAGTTAPPATGS